MRSFHGSEAAAGSASSAAAAKWWPEPTASLLPASSPFGWRGTFFSASASTFPGERLAAALALAMPAPARLTWAAHRSTRWLPHVLSDGNEEKAAAAWRALDVAAAAAAAAASAAGSGGGGGRGSAGITMAVGDVAATRAGAGETLGGSEGGGDGVVERSTRDVVREKGEARRREEQGLAAWVMEVGGREK